MPWMAPTRPSWSPSWPSSPTSTGRRPRSGWRGRCSSTAVTPLSRPCWWRSASPTRGWAAPSRPANSPHHLVQAIVLVGGEGTRLLNCLPSRAPKLALTLVDRPVPGLHDRAARPTTGWRKWCLPAASSRTSCARRSGDGAAGRGARSLHRPSPGRWAPAVRSATPPTSSAGAGGERFLPLNGDVLTDLDLTALLRAHESRRAAAATIGLHPVLDARRLRPGQAGGGGNGPRLRGEDGPA